jgi:hypothetical protein
MSHWHAEIWIRIWDISVVLCYYLCSCGESRLLILLCVGDKCDMSRSDEDCGRSRRLVQRIGDGQVQVGYSVAGQSGGQMMLCAVCTIHMDMRSIVFLVWPQNQGLRFVNSLALKPLAQILLDWPQNWWLGFPDLGLKIGSSGLVIWSSKSLQHFLSFGLKTKRVSICRLHHKIDGGNWRGSCIEI